MKIFLLWHHNSDHGRSLDPNRVATSLQKLFLPLFSNAPPVQIRRNTAATLVFLELPVRGWIPEFAQEDERTWTLAVDYPLNARSVLSANGIRFQENNVLPSLGRAMEGKPDPLLREMTPPFSMIWGSKLTNEVYVQNDGLGQSQLFEYHDEQCWALTNKIFALKALAITPELDKEQWAVRCTLGAFALDTTGFKNTRFIGPGTQYRLDSNGIHKTQHDVLSEWVSPKNLTKDDCLELARCSLVTLVKEVMPLCEKPLVDLTSGWDSRSVVSILRGVGESFSLRVKGMPEKYDRIIASKLAKIAGLDLQIFESAELPPAESNELRKCITLALLWQAGYMWTERQKSFLWEEKHLDGGVVNIMGHHSSIGRAKYERKIRAAALREGQYEDGLVQLWLAEMPALIRKGLHEPVCEAIRKGYRQADGYGLAGLARLDFWYLYERNRRYNGASVTSQTGLVIAPFMNPDYIRSVYTFRAHGGQFVQDHKLINPFQRHIIETHAPDWVDTPYEKDLMKMAKREPQNNILAAPDRQMNSFPRWRKCPGKDYYDYTLYWQEVGSPIIEEALARGGFWEEIFDVDRVQKERDKVTIELGMMYLLPSLI